MNLAQLCFPPPLPLRFSRSHRPLRWPQQGSDDVSDVTVPARYPPPSSKGTRAPRIPAPPAPCALSAGVELPPLFAWSPPAAFPLPPPASLTSFDVSRFAADANGEPIREPGRQRYGRAVR